MNTYAICYHSTSSNMSNRNFHETIKNIGSAWWHHMEWLWLVQADKSADEIYDTLRPQIGDTERLLVVEVTDNCQGWLPEKAWQWINQHFPHEKAESPDKP